jgi:GAF domain-containing protein
MDGAPDVPAVLRATCRELVGLVGAEGCLISRVIGELLIEVAAHAPDGKDLTAGHGYLIPDYPLTQQVIELREPRTVSVHDPAAEPNEVALLRELGYEALLMLPLVSADECWGLVELYGGPGRIFGDEDTSRAAAALDRAAASLAQA